MYVIIWEYVPRAGAEDEFERACRPDGLWGAFFRQSRHYRGTELLKDVTRRRYWTIDRWDTRESHEQFIAEHQHRYDEIDRRCAELTEAEKELGHFEVVG